MHRPAALAAVVLLAGCPAQSMQADVAALNDLRARIQAAENAGLADSMAAVFADDVVIMPANAPAVTGKTAAHEMLRGFLAAYSFTTEYTSQEVMIDRLWAFDRGTYRQTITPRAGGAGVTEVGKYLWVYHRQPSGQWRSARVIWNADAAP